MSPSGKSFTMYVILGLKIYLMKNWIVQRMQIRKINNLGYLTNSKQKLV